MSGLTALEPSEAQPSIDWRSIIAGAAVASGISITLLAFGSAIGLSVVSSAPSWRDSSPWLWILSGIFLLLVTLTSFGAGGYVCGRIKVQTWSLDVGEGEFRDGLHGVIVWGVALSFAALLAVTGAATGLRSGSPGGDLSVHATGEGLISFELDDLFRGDRNSSDVSMAYRRAEAARILLKSSSHAGISADDRDYLAMIVKNQVALNGTAAVERVNRVIAEVRQELHRGRQAAVMEAFLAAVALTVGMAMAWFAAIEGGREFARKPTDLTRRQH